MMQPSLRTILTVFLPGVLMTLAVAAETPAVKAAPIEAPAAKAPLDVAAERASAIFEKYRLPGFAVAVARGEQIVYTGYFGYANLEHRVPITRLTRFRVGSISKLLTIAAVARLHQEGKLDLDAPVQRYVPYFPEKKWPLSTRQLASHTGGIRHYAPKDFQAILAKFMAQPPIWSSVEESLSIFMDDALAFEPGTSYGYSSYGYNLVSAVVEGASGQPFLDYMAEHVLGSLGLASTAADDWRALVEHRTSFYYANPETGEVVHDVPADNSYKWAGGGFLSSVEDLVKLASVFVEPGFVEEATLAEVFTPQPNAEDRGFRVGLGWRIEEDDQGRRIYHHAGAIGGGRGVVLTYPGEKLSVALLANSYARFGKREALSLVAPFLGDP